MLIHKPVAYAIKVFGGNLWDIPIKCRNLHRKFVPNHFSVIYESVKFFEISPWRTYRLRQYQL